MYYIVNSIDPLDLKEDDNDSDCSDSWELLDYEKEICTEENKNGTGKQEEKANSSLPNKSNKTNHGDDTAKAKADSGKQEGVVKSRKSSSNRKQTVSFEISNLVSKEQKLKQKIELPTTATTTTTTRTKSTTKSSKEQTVPLASKQSQIEAERAQNANNNDNVGDDDDSMDSSGFSDCDYGFGGLNDYVMRPKRAQAKRRRNASSSSSSILISMSKRGNERKNESRTSEVAPQHNKDSKSQKQQDSSATSAVKQQSTSSRNIKPKRKKLVLSSSSSTAATSHSDFLKKPTAQRVAVATQPTMMMKSTTTTTGATSDSIVAEVTEPIQVNNNINKQELMPPPAASSVPLCRASSNNTSSNDSSDIPDMDESWYLTPPPCFTGAAANKLCIIPKPKAKEAVRENMLIEHPSIYIASTSRQQDTSTTNLPSKKSVKETLIKQKAIVLRKVSSKQSSSFSSVASSSASSSSKVNSDEKEKTPNKAAAANKVGSESKRNVKCWDNKFVVANWADDEQADFDDDFDNLFPVLGRPSGSTVALNAKRTAAKDKLKAPTNKSSGRKTDKEVRSVRNKDASPNCFDSKPSSDGHDSDFSIPRSPTPLEDGIEVIIDCNQASVPLKSVVTIDDLVKVENVEPKRRRNKSSSSEQKVPVKVEPIEPERQPGWQLKKKRALSKRRPLTNLVVVTPSSSKQVATASKKQTSNRQRSGESYMGPHGGELSYPGSGSSGSSEWSARSSPTLIDRIGSSIVANLTNLTSSFAQSTGMNMQAPRAALGEASEKMNQMRGLMSKSEGGSGGPNNLKARKQMSKAFLNRQNICVMAGNTKRRADRRKRMHTTPNGSSVNRKVHTNFH